MSAVSARPIYLDGRFAKLTSKPVRTEMKKDERMWGSGCGEEDGAFEQLR